jgi:hypothetical protein
VEAALELVWASILVLDFVVERSDIGRDISRCDCGSGGEERGEDCGREIHDVAKSCENGVEIMAGWTDGLRYICLAGYGVTDGIEQVMTPSATTSSFDC